MNVMNILNLNVEFIYSRISEYNFVSIYFSFLGDNSRLDGSAEAPVRAPNRQCPQITEPQVHEESPAHCTAGC